MTEIVNIISSVGFPIVSFLICAWFIKYTYDKSMIQTDNALEKIGTLADAVNTNTLVLSELVKEIRGDNKK